MRGRGLEGRMGVGGLEGRIGGWGVVIFLPILCHILSPECGNSIISILYLSEALVRRGASASSCSNLLPPPQPTAVPALIFPTQMFRLGSWAWRTKAIKFPIQTQPSVLISKFSSWSLSLDLSTLSSQISSKITSILVNRC